VRGHAAQAESEVEGGREIVVGVETGNRGRHPPQLARDGRVEFERDQCRRQRARAKVFTEGDHGQ
jgi:hypothetical protein